MAGSGDTARVTCLLGHFDRIAVRCSLDDDNVSRRDSFEGTHSDKVSRSESHVRWRLRFARRQRARCASTNRSPPGGGFSDSNLDLDLEVHLTARPFEIEVAARFTLRRGYEIETTHSFGIQVVGRRDWFCLSVVRNI